MTSAQSFDLMRVRDIAHAIIYNTRTCRRAEIGREAQRGELRPGTSQTGYIPTRLP